MNDSRKYGIPSEPAEREVGFFLVSSFTLLSFVAAIEPLRVANRMSGRSLYSWRLFTVDGEPAIPSNGMTQAVDDAIDRAPHLPIVIVCGPYEPSLYKDKKVLSWLRKLARNGTQLGAVDTGSYVLARAGLLNGYRCTIHWENLPGFAQEFPDIEVSTALFEFDRDRMTCAGGTAALDMMLRLIAEHHDHRLATAVAEGFIQDIIRHPDEPQRMSLRSRTGVSHPKLLGCIALMEANLEQPLLHNELASAVGLSKRQMERLFSRYLDTTPSRYYMDLRLKMGRRLLEQTSLPILEVALACGFSSPGHFSHRYRALFGVSPRQERNTG
jgi:transcriptional regulator GlxA family with amidase domain